ncbi:MAG: Tripartite-type tricarboxylate transporter, receptor component TctC [Rhodospirillales bacterium]|nr:Tripartite-type tricarboxylate transporter, receptor component TctC [Rhodospirillales bacterium]
MFRRLALSLAILVAPVLLLALSCGLARADDAYPNRPITIIVPWGAGGGADQVARTLSKLVEPVVKVSMPVINVPGATGQTGLVKLWSGNAEGYEMGVMTADTFVLLSGPNARFGMDALIPLAIMTQQPSGLFVKMDSPWKSWDDVIAASKQKPLRVAVTGFNSPDDLSVRYLRSKGVQVESVPFPEPGLRYASVIGGQSDLVYEQAGDVRSFLDGKQIRPVIFFADAPAPGYADIPTSKSLGYSLKLTQFRALVIKAGTDPKRVKILADTLAAAAQQDDYKKYLAMQICDPASFVGTDTARAYLENWMKEAVAVAAATADTTPKN